MKSEEFKLREQKYYILTFVCGIAALWGSHELSKSAFSNSELLSDLVRDLGIALLIGAYLGVTIERLNKSRMRGEVQAYIKDVGDNFIKAVYGKALPNELFQIVKSSVFEQSFVRTTFWNHIYLHDFDDQLKYLSDSVRAKIIKFKNDTAENPELCANRLFFKTSTHYTVMNISSKSQSCPIVFGVEKPFGGTYDDNMYGLCGITSIIVDGKELISGDGYFSNKGGNESRDNTILQFNHDQEIDPGKSVKVSIEAYSLRDNDGSDSWFIGTIQNGAKLTVADSDGDKDITIAFGVPYLNESERLAKKNPKTNTATLETNNYLLPGQGFIISWRPLRKLENSSPETPSQTAVVEKDEAPNPANSSKA